MPDILDTVPARRGHFLLESGYHTDLWLSLEALFVDPWAIAPQIAALAEALQPYALTAICGCLLGGAFLAQALAAHMGLRFYYAEPVAIPTDGSLFSAQYRLPPDLRRRIASERVAVVDDVISAGSSVRATVADVATTGATIAVVASLVRLGSQADVYFGERGLPLVALAQQDFHLWPPATCPLCQTDMPLENPLISL